MVLWELLCKVKAELFPRPAALLMPVAGACSSEVRPQWDLAFPARPRGFCPRDHDLRRQLVRAKQALRQRVPGPVVRILQQSSRKFRRNFRAYKKKIKGKKGMTKTDKRKGATKQRRKRKSTSKRNKRAREGERERERELYFRHFVELPSTVFPGSTKVKPEKKLKRYGQGDDVTRATRSNELLHPCVEQNRHALH